jgi:hypothetical protein
MKPDQTIGYQDASRFMSGLYDGDLHAKRVLSLANATLGVVRTASLAVSTIGQGLALARGLVTKPPSAAVTVMLPRKRMT